LRVNVPLSDRGAVELSEVVARLAGATGLDVPRPPAGISLPLHGLGRSLGKKLLASKLGEGVGVAIRNQTLVLTVDPELLAPGVRGEWERRIRDLAAEVEREARRRQAYGMRALGSYRPNDPSRPTVCLVHGVNSTSGGFTHMVGPLEEAGFGIVLYDYPFNRSLEESAARFARDWSAFRRESGETRPWALVGHSMGALVARDYVEGPAYGGDVSTLVMIAPVNQGSYLAKSQTVLQLIKGVRAVNGRRASDALAHLGDGLGEAAADMTPGSAYLKALNARPRRAGVAYHILAGDVGVLSVSARRQVEDQVGALTRQGGLFGGLTRAAVGGHFSERLDEITDGAGDGCVAVARTKLSGVADHVVIHANHAELIRAPLLYPDPGPVACMPYLLRWLGNDAAADGPAPSPARTRD
jgi:pimeloyl-ACP methyl ester carboxylesterase